LVKDHRIWFGEGGANVPSLKVFLSEVREGVVPVTVWLYDDVGHNQVAKQELKDLFSDEFPFESPKPVSLLKRILQIATDKDSILLDSFAGSGTTMHAVMDLNKDDGGNRKCILIQMTEATEAEPQKNICKDITRERVKRAIEKFGYKSGFKYLRVGTSIDPESMLSGQLPTYKQFAKHVYYLCTGEYLEDEKRID
jgi:adenine-specific DNA-methyltransferase